MSSDLSPYITNTNSNIFVIRNLDPEIIGAALARYSRAPTGLKETIAREFLDENGLPNQEKGTQMIDRVLNKFGDESVGELATATLCLENISNLVIKMIEDCRIGGSPIEESTRYVLYDKKQNGKWRYYIPPNLPNHLKTEYEKTLNFCFETYSSMVAPMMELFKKRLPKENFQIDVDRGGKVKAKLSELISEKEKKAHRIAYNFTIRSAACDIIRCILPAATQANVGIVGNGRYFTKIISKLLSSNLKESQITGKKVKQELNHIIPTFIKRSGVNHYRNNIDANMKKYVDSILLVDIDDEEDVVFIESNSHCIKWFRKNIENDMISNNRKYDLKLLADMVWQYSDLSSRQIMGELLSMKDSELEKLFNIYISNRKTKRDRPGRALETGYAINFELTGSFAEYRDLHRHRMLSQQRQNLTTKLGYTIPPEIFEINKGEEVHKCFKNIERLHDNLINEQFFNEAQYATLFNHKIRWQMGMNLREFEHLVELRTIKAGHPKYRKMCQDMVKLYIKKHPEMEPLFEFVDYNDYNDGIARAEQEANTAFKSLKTNLPDDVD